MIFEKKLNELAARAQDGYAFDSRDLLNSAEKLLSDDHIKLPKELLHKYLNLTRLPIFLLNLKTTEECYRWAGSAFEIIRKSNYSLLDMFNQRVSDDPKKILFSVLEGNIRNDYSFKLVKEKILRIAASFYNYREKPSIAIYMDNCIEGALCDLASLCYDIFVSPLNVHFGLENLQYIFRQLNFNIVITDTPQRVELLKTLREKSVSNFLILYKGNQNAEGRIKDAEVFDQFISLIKEDEIDLILERRKHFALDDISSVMFTSGSTGLPKGVAFTNYNILTKRFARGAVFPSVGSNEILLSFLPLFHTFGRYFEMLGMVYWGGNYVFAGKNDFDSLIQLMPAIKPTGLVSIPLRWKQIYELVIDKSRNSIGRNDKKDVLEIITGGSLRWGISAAGYLEPKVFSFFNSCRVDLCSGFGMTEATGGISMTPPGEYIKDSVGLPLPGIKLRFSDRGELQISGDYVAKYLDDIDNPGLNEYWLNTGDLFTQDKNGYLFIIDRIKDIYKNSKGQTIAPAFIEKKFENIPGLKRAFLAGDMKPYNTLLIVPDFNEPFIEKAESQQKLKNYFRALVFAVNRTLNPVERIVKFVLLDRDFSEQKGELTAKGTFKRKVIESNFKNIIDTLYSKSGIEFGCLDLKVLIPIWALKDLGITENDIRCSKHSIVNKEDGTELTIKKTAPGKVKIGNFEYVISKKEIDLGTFILQPILWAGNIELIEFFICKEEWDSDFQGISSQIFINHKRKNHLPLNWPKNTERFSPGLKEINKIILKALFGNENEILSSLIVIEKMLTKGEHKINNLLSRRLEILATHPSFKVRSQAYKVLLFSKPDLDYNRYLPAFINSGLPFLNKKIIGSIFDDSIDGFNLDAFRKRMESYRDGLKWPAGLNTREQFKRILDLFVKYVHKNPSAYITVRVELIIWILHKEDPALSEYAQHLFRKLAGWFEARFKLNQYEKSVLNWREKVIFQEAIPPEEKKRIEKILFKSTFLKEAFMLIFNRQHFDLRHVNRSGIFISTIFSAKGRYLYRISINTTNYKHYDLVILIKPDITRKEVLETIYLMIKISGAPGSTSVLPKLGNFRSKLGVISFEFINNLSVWERIRLLNSTLPGIGKKDYEFELKLLFIRGIAAYFMLLKNSGFKVVPGNLSPSNTTVPEPHFKKGSQVISITGWTAHKNFENFFVRLFNNFFLQTYAHYPSSKDSIKISWIFDACLEAMGREEGLSILRRLQQDLNSRKIEEHKNLILNEVTTYISIINNIPYVNSFILSAVKGYGDWITENPSASKKEKENFVNNLFSLYRMDKYPEIGKYIFYSRTYFSDSPGEVWLLFSKFINSLFRFPDEPAASRIELAELQEALTDETDKRVLNNLIYPQINQNFELAAGEESEEKEVVLKTKANDSFGLDYTIRKPASAFEIASLHKIFILDNYSVKIDPQLHYLVIADDEDQDNIAGGLCYKVEYMDIARLEGIVISQPYRGRDLSRKLLEDFFGRLKSSGIKTVATYFYLNTFFEKFGFKPDRRWGGLVKIIE